MPDRPKIKTGPSGEGCNFSKHDVIGDKMNLRNFLVLLFPAVVELVASGYSHSVTLKLLGKHHSKCNL